MYWHADGARGQLRAIQSIPEATNSLIAFIVSLIAHFLGVHIRRSHWIQIPHLIHNEACGKSCHLQRVVFRTEAGI